MTDISLNYTVSRNYSFPYQSCCELGIPFALFIGPQRAGTSWLDRYMRWRGDICLPKHVKEVFFFDRNYNKGKDFYFNHFQLKNAHRLALEFTTTSFADEHAPARILETFGKRPILICPLREPVRRSYSLYVHFKRYGIVKGDIKEALTQRPDILESSRYALHLNRWADTFGKDNIKVTYQEHMKIDREEYLREVCGFLGIPYIPPSGEICGLYNSSTKPPSYLVARMAQKGADYLRSKGMYSVITVAKAMGLKRVLFGKSNPDPEPYNIPDRDFAILKELLAGEKEKLEEFLDKPVPYW
jgi:hypothetical protein